MLTQELMIRVVMGVMEGSVKESSMLWSRNVKRMRSWHIRIDTKPLFRVMVEAPTRWTRSTT